MINNINNFGVINFYENSKNSHPQNAHQAEDIIPIEEQQTTVPDSMIFTRKAKQESKVNVILQALQKSVVGRKDKTRAFVQELHAWQKDEYIDAHFNARVMYDELGNMLPLPFGYEVFKKHYNNTRI